MMMMIIIIKIATTNLTTTIYNHGEVGNNKDNQNRDAHNKNNIFLGYILMEFLQKKRKKCFGIRAYMQTF